jgi:signal recognition particle subunit SRP54
MKQMARGGGAPGLPGMGNLPGMGGKKSRGRMAPQAKVKGRSGNPAKRAQQEREAAARASGQAPKAPAGSAFGVGPAAKPDVDPTTLGLPPGLEKFLGR